MRNLRGNQNTVPDFDQFGFRPLMSPANITPLESRHARAVVSQSRPAASSATKPQATNQDTDQFVRDALQIHNDLRRRHGVEPLRLNNDLSKLAQQWGE